MAGSAADVDQPREASERKPGGDRRALRPIDSPHESCHRLAAFFIRCDVLKECYSVDARERLIARHQHLFEMFPSAQHGIMVQDKAHFAQ